MVDQVRSQLTTEIASHEVLSDTLNQDAESIQKSLDLSGLAGEAPSVVPGYRILKPIGEGKYGSVWLAREQNTGKHVAIKFYTHRRGVDWSLLGREVEKLAVLYTSRNIVGLLAVGWDHDPPYYVMEYLENGSLAARLAVGPLAVADAVRIATRVCQALVHAHGSGILHCDLKPANILLDQDFEPRLCDFGQSRLADEHSHSLGTLFYMAPEQADLKAVPDARWDVYALGALIFNMLTGTPPHRTEETERRLSSAGTLEERLSIYRQIVRSDARPTSHRSVFGIDQQLCEIVDRCLAADPAKRFPNAQAVLDKLVSRERFRARRPLILLGLILPLLLLLSIAPLAMDTMNDAVRTTQDNLIRRALESDVLSANLLADSINRELEDRRHELETLAADTRLREEIASLAVLPIAQRKPLIDHLDRLKRENDERSKELSRVQDSSWFLLDASGIQRWRSPASQMQDENMAWRDFFHGSGNDWPRNEVPVDIHAIRTCRISIPFKSASNELYVVALSVPVFDPQKSEDVIGVLCRTLTLGSLIKDYQRNWQTQISDGVNRKLAIVDGGDLDGERHWQLLAHSWMDDSQLGQISEADFRKLRLKGIVDDEVLENLEELIRQNKKGDPSVAKGEYDRTRHYLDPVHQFDPDTYGGEWLAAFSPVGNTKWAAVVQERKDVALRPVEELKARMLNSAIGGVLVVLGLVAGSWWLIVALLNERAPRWLKFWQPRAARTGTTMMSLTGKTVPSD
ncbi:serine/threonine protein kinase [Schlesneria sp. DSM 10557]|uniref:serine/threonine protein kinase n=1 Tax=Schlesneria sp. DSM 10557 TaxID=3044399 RepID=UPI00359F6D67